jgi:hypothetical protein
MTTTTIQTVRYIFCIAGLLGGTAAWSDTAERPVDCTRLPLAFPAPVVPPGAVEKASPVPGTALRTFATHDVREVQASDSKGTDTLLILMQQGTPAPLLSIGREPGASTRRIAVYAPAASLPVEEVRLSTAESLYALVMRQSPHERFEFADTRARPAFARGMTQASALAVSHDMRTCAAKALLQKRADVKITPWRTAIVKPLPSRGNHRLMVSARVQDAQGKPLTGQVTFGRGGHLACAAPLGPNGQGSCTLFDSHGHELHDNEHKAPTTVTFSGAVSATHIVLPTTKSY